MNISIGDTVQTEDGEELIVKNIEDGVPIVGTEIVSLEEIDENVPKFSDGTGTYNNPEEASGKMKQKIYAAAIKFGPAPPWEIMEHVDGDKSTKRKALRSLILHHKALTQPKVDGNFQPVEPRVI